MSEEQRPKRFYEKYGDDYAELSEGFTVQGEIHGTGKHANIRISGTVEGDIRASGVVEVGESGHCKGILSAACVVVSGRVDGELYAREKIELGNTALINGDIEAPHLAVAEGCRFNGSIKSGGTLRHNFTERRKKTPKLS